MRAYVCPSVCTSQGASGRLVSISTPVVGLVVALSKPSIDYFHPSQSDLDPRACWTDLLADRDPLQSRRETNLHLYCYFLLCFITPYCILLYFIVPSVLWRCWLGGRKGIRPVKTEWWGAGVVVWSELQPCIWSSWCHCHSLSLASLKSTLVSPFWCRLTWVVPEKGR